MQKMPRIRKCIPRSIAGCCHRRLNASNVSAAREQASTCQSAFACTWATASAIRKCRSVDMEW